MKKRIFLERANVPRINKIVLRVGYAIMNGSKFYI